MFWCQDPSSCMASWGSTACLTRPPGANVHHAFQLEARWFPTEYSCKTRLCPVEHQRQVTTLVSEGIEEVHNMVVAAAVNHRLQPLCCRTCQTFYG